MSETPKVLRADGRQNDDRCPVCHSGREKRIPSSGFGSPHDVCGDCGYEFGEFTCN